MRDRLGLIPDINVTPLVDVMLVLLIIFMITAPFLEEGVEVNLPQTVTEPLEAEEGLTVTLTREGTIFIGDVQVSWEAFSDVFPQVIRDRRGPVYIKGDGEVQYGSVMELLGVIREAGVVNVGLVAQPRREPDGR